MLRTCNGTFCIKRLELGDFFHLRNLEAMCFKGVIGLHTAQKHVQHIQVLQPKTMS